MKLSGSVRKQLILFGSIFLGVAAFVLVIGLGVLPRYEFPNRHDEARYGRLYVRVGGEWTQEQRARISEALRNLSRLGPGFTRLSDTDPLPNGGMLVRLRKGEWSVLDNEASGSPADVCRREGVGRYVTGSPEVWVDPGCAPGPQITAAIMHEIGHWIGMGHVCRDATDNAGTRCSSVGHGPAFMNPHVAYGETEIGFDRAATGPVANTMPTRLDVSEFDRVWPSFQRRWRARP